MKKKGFTLIELLVVISIIGVLSIIIISSVGSVKGRANDAKLQRKLNNLQTELEIYYLDHGEYPAGSYYSYFNPEASEHQFNYSLHKFAEVLGVEDIDAMFPCGRFDANCKQRFYYNSPRNGTNANCWKNHYHIQYWTENPVTSRQPITELPCGTGTYGDYDYSDIEIPNYCKNITNYINLFWGADYEQYGYSYADVEEYYGWDCGWYYNWESEQRKNYSLIIK